MYSDYFILITNKEFGVFEPSASDYPREFKKNIHNVRCVNGSDLNEYLVHNLGKNLLINKNFKIPWSIGIIYSRETN